MDLKRTWFLMSEIMTLLDRDGDGRIGPEEFVRNTVRVVVSEPSQHHLAETSLLHEGCPGRGRRRSLTPD